MRRFGFALVTLLPLTVITACGKDNKPPVAHSTTVQLREDTVVSGILSAEDPEGSKLSFTLQSHPMHGNVSVDQSTGEFAYRPQADFYGTDSFDFVASDGKKSSAVATVTLDVAPVNDAPEATPLMTTLYQGTSTTDRLLATDIEGDEISFFITRPPQHGQIVLNPVTGEFTYHPDPEFKGDDLFQFQASDGEHASETIHVLLTVAPVEAVRDTPMVAAGSTTEIDVVANDVGMNPLASVVLIGEPLTGKATVEGTSIRYEAPQEPGRDMLVYEIQVGGHRSLGLVDISVLSADDPGLKPPPGVRVMRQAVQPPVSEEDLYVPVDSSRDDIQALRPLALEILAAYGNPTSNLDRARALREWVARTAIHPYPPLHPDGSQANLAVLPEGATWADVNNLYAQKFDSDSAYWRQVHYNGYAMLDRLLGTLDPLTGIRADDGLMERVGPAHYRIRNISDYRYVLCSYQNVMLISLWGSIGLQGLLLSTVGHDPAAVFIPELGRWIYQDSTYNEEFTLTDSNYLLSPLELLAISRANRKDKITPQKMTGPQWSPDVYVDARLDPAGTYFGDGHPSGMNIMGSQLNNDTSATPEFRVRAVQIPVPDLPRPFNDPSQYLPVDPSIAFPRPGVRIASFAEEANKILVELEPTHSSYSTFERRIELGPWEQVSAIDSIPRTEGDLRVTYRGVDSQGISGTVSSIRVTPNEQT